MKSPFPARARTDLAHNPGRFPHLDHINAHRLAWLMNEIARSILSLRIKSAARS